MIQSGVVAFETTGLFSAIQAIVYGFIMHMADQCHLAGFAKVNLHNTIKKLTSNSLGFRQSSYWTSHVSAIRRGFWQNI